MKHHWLFLFLKIFAGLLAVQACAFAAAARRPNILVILTDDLGRGDYSAFGTKDIRTPNIDRIYREGMNLKNFHANSCVCSPSRAALLSGCFPDRVGIPGMVREEEPDKTWGFLAPDAVLLPQMLKPAGYHTAAIGKWNLGLTSPNLPVERGFDHYQGFLGDMMDDYWSHLRHGLNLMRLDGQPIDPKGHATDLFTDWACDYIEQRTKTAQPFFLYLAYNAPHDPVQPPPEWLEKVRQREPGISEKRAKIVALIEHLDAGIGRVLDALDRTGAAKDTLVIFTSDNGGLLSSGANNGPWRSGKTHMYEGGLRVPGAARWPGVIQPGSESDGLMLTMDIFATACDAAGVKVPANIDGLSFLPALRGTPEPQLQRDTYFVWLEGGLQHGGLRTNAFCRGDWKLVHDSPWTPLELYNLRDDPQEKNDLAAKNKAKLTELTLALCLQTQRGGQVPWQRRVIANGSTAK